MTEPTNTESRILFQRAQGADTEAQQDLHDRYAARLLALVRARINREVQARFDAEDVINSAFRSFFVALLGDRFSLPAHGGLWPLLAQITLHKLHRATQHHYRLRRAAGSEERLADESTIGARDHDESAEFSLHDELAWLAGKLPPGAATAMELSIQGFSHEEVAEQLQCTSRTVRRYLAEARALLRVRLSRCADYRDEPGSASDLTDELVFDNYLLRRMIGAGVFGKVYLATDQTTGADVAIKYLRKRWTKDPQVVRRFVDETDLLRQLNIDGVVPCYGGGNISDGGQFFVMKWIDGQTLADRVAQRRLSEVEVRREFVPLANCLQQVHAQGITHCDLKPTNILIDRNGRWWLTDFGFARHTATSIPALAGTPAFMAPEQLDPFFGPIGAWTDLYAVGKLILASVSGEPASPDSLTAAPPTAEQLLADDSVGISDELAAILRRLLHRRTGDRLASAGELARLLSTG